MLTDSIASRVDAFARARKPMLIACDLDGTLAPIVPQPADARVPRETLDILKRLTTVARVAVITGRDLSTARLMVPFADVTVIGSHGLEATIESRLLPAVDRLRLAATLERLEQTVIEAVPPIFVHIERKAISTAFHFRNAPQLEDGLREALADLPDGLRLREGRMVLEVVPNVPGGKDVGFRAVADHFKVQSALVMGDDLTDLAMFAAAAELRTNGHEALIVGVSGGAETPEDLAAQSDLLIDSPADSAALLERLATNLGA